VPKRIPTHRSPWAAASRQAAVKQYEQAPQRQDDKDFYKSKPWRALRQLKLSVAPLCEDCYEQGRYEPATEVHHVIDRKANPDLALDLGNLRSQCKRCHSRKATFGRKT
jgi:5-methylcytosine-specific restriction protein A